MLKSERVPLQNEQVKKFLSELQGKLSVNDFIIERTMHIYNTAYEKELVQGRTASILLISAFYAACRETGTTISLSQIMDASNIEQRKDIVRCYKLLIKRLDLHISITDPLNCVSQIAIKAGISDTTKDKAIALLNESKISAGKDPMGFAGAALYSASIINIFF